MNDKIQVQINDLRQTLETIHAYHADFAQSTRRRFVEAIKLVDAGRPDLARELLHREAEALGESWAAGDVGGRA